MSRIRLQICVLPWEQPRPSPFSSAETRQETVKWCEPCTENTPMQEVCDKIYISWGRMFEGSMGPLNIRYLKTAYGDFVDLEQRIVGDLFDDRGNDGNIRNSILEVHRYPPQSVELGTLQRFTSLAPDSSARPHKRPFEQSSLSYPSQHSRNIHREIPSIEESDAEPDRPFGTATKRQRTYESRLNRTSAAHQPLRMHEGQRDGLYHSSQTSGTQESIHQVLDSQISPGKKHSNPYGTPTSLTLVGPQESIPGNEVDLAAIPDSPLGRETTAVGRAFGGAMQLDRESTKSESPELRASVHEVPPAGTLNASGGQPTTSANSPEPSMTPFIFSSTLQPVSIPQIVDEYAKNHGIGVRQIGEKAANVNQTPRHVRSTAEPAHAQNVGSSSRTLRSSDPIFDPIESDTESFHEKQQMQSAKRLKSSKTTAAGFTSPHTSDEAGADRRDGQFLVPTFPQSRKNGAPISLSEVTSPAHCEKTQKPRRDARDENMSDQSVPKRHGKHDTEPLEHAQSEPYDNDRTNLNRETPKGSTVHNDLVDATQTSSQANTAWSQDSNKSANGTEESIAQQRGNHVSSQGQKPDETVCLGHDANGVVHNPGDNRFAREAERLAEEAEELREKKRIREKKDEEEKLARDALEKENVAKKKAAEHRANEERLADVKEAKEMKARAEESAQAKKAKAKEEELAEAKRIEEKRVNAARLAEEKKITEKLARERQTRETALAEEANKVMLTADGAKQIEAEKKEKEREKARLKELAAKKQADEAKADEKTRETQGKNREKKAREEQRARENPQKPADIHSKDTKHRTHRAGTAQETATALKEQGLKSLADGAVQTLRDSSEMRSRASTDPSASSNIAGRKRSMTPVIPGCSVTKSSPYEGSLRSSPSSNRSSGNMDAPLRSALRHTPSALRRSVSSVSFDVPPRAKLNEYIPPTPKSRSLKGINNELATKSSSATNPPKNPPRTASIAPSETPMKSLIPKKSSDSKITKIPAKNGKVQTKLNVTREVKKKKGRAVDPPIMSTRAPKKEIVLSSGEDTSTSEEPVWQTGNAEAGPSARKLIFPVTTSQEKKTAEVKSSGVPLDPVFRNIRVEKHRTAAPATLPRSTSKLDTTSLQKSTSRSPALALSETLSLSSGSASSIASDSELESDAWVELQASSTKTPTGAKNGKLAPVTVEGSSKAVNVGVKQPEGYLQSKASWQSSQALSSWSRSTISMHGDGKHVDQAADKQLQLESQQSIPRPRVKQSSSTTNGAADGKVINQGLDHAGRLPNGIRPAYYKYPRLSELQKVPRAVTPGVNPKLDTSSSQPLGVSPVGKSGSDKSSSDSDDSSSNSDEDEDVGEPPGQASSNKKFRPYPGMGGVMKLANAVRSKFVPAQQ